MAFFGPRRPKNFEIFVIISMSFFAIKFQVQCQSQFYLSVVIEFPCLAIHFFLNATLAGWKSFNAFWPHDKLIWTHQTYESPRTIHATKCCFHHFVTITLVKWMCTWHSDMLWQPCYNVAPWNSAWRELKFLRSWLNQLMKKQHKRVGKNKIWHNIQDGLLASSLSGWMTLAKSWHFMLILKKNLFFSMSLSSKYSLTTTDYVNEEWLNGLIPLKRSSLNECRGGSGGVIIP